jgi:polysaccharide chain length determinant protein (PEP-CTERM system associated)
VTPGKQYGPDQLLAIARRRKWLLIVPFFVIAVGTALVSARLPNMYRSETLILIVPQRVPESYVKSTVTSRIEDRLQSISQQILSRTRLERIIQDFGLYTVERRTAIMEDIVEKMRRDIDVQIVKGDAFRVSFNGRDPHTTMKVTERLASLFIEENLRDRAVLAEDSYEFIETQLEDARRRLLEHEKKLEEYRRKYVGELPSQLDSNLQLIQNTQMQIQGLNESMARDRDRRLVLERLLADASASDPAPAPAVSSSGAPAPGSPAQQLEAAREALKQMELRLTPEHPDILRAKRVVARLQTVAQEAAAVPVPDVQEPKADAAKRNRLKEIAGELEQLDRQFAKKETDEKQLRAVVDRYQARVESTPTRESEMIELSRDYDTLQKTYTSLLMKKEDSKLAANLERRQIGEQFKILDPARVAEKPFSPDRLRINLIGALIGLVIGFGLVALLELNDTTLKSDDEIMQAFSLPVLAMVPMMVTPQDERTAKLRRLLVFASSCAVAIISVALIAWKLRQ